MDPMSRECPIQPLPTQQAWIYRVVMSILHRFAPPNDLGPKNLESVHHRASKLLPRTSQEKSLEKICPMSPSSPKMTPRRSYSAQRASPQALVLHPSLQLCNSPRILPGLGFCVPHEVCESK